MVMVLGMVVVERVGTMNWLDEHWRMFLDDGVADGMELALRATKVALVGKVLVLTLPEGPAAERLMFDYATRLEIRENMSRRLRRPISLHIETEPVIKEGVEQ